MLPAPAPPPPAGGAGPPPAPGGGGPPPSRAGRLPVAPPRRLPGRPARTALRSPVAPPAPPRPRAPAPALARPPPARSAPAGCGRLGASAAPPRRRQRAVALPYGGRFGQLGHRDAGADAQSGALAELDAAQLRQAAEAHDVGGQRDLAALFDLRDNVRAAGQGATAFALLPEQGDGFSKALRGEILEPSHGRPQPPWFHHSKALGLGQTTVYVKVRRGTCWSAYNLCESCEEALMLFFVKASLPDVPPVPRELWLGVGVSTWGGSKQLEKHG